MGMLDSLLGGGSTRRRRRAKRSRKHTYKVFDGNDYYLDTVEARSPTHARKIVFFRRFGVHVVKTSKLPRGYRAKRVKA